MKKLLVIVIAVMISTVCYSQKVTGTFTIPESEKFISLAWDWSEAVIDKKLSEKDWAAINGEEYWEKAKMEALILIAREMNEKMTKSRVSILSPESDRETAYRLFISPIWYTKKGNNESIYILKDISTGNEIGRCRLKGDGGSIGSVANLLGDGYEEAARKMGSMLKKFNKIK